MADRVQQVGLAEAGAAIEKQRVVAVRGALGDGARRGVRELVGGADDEGLEHVARVELRLGGRGESRLRSPLLESEDDAGRPGQRGRGGVEERAVGFLEGVQEVRVGRHEDDFVGLLAPHPQGFDPGLEVVPLEPGEQVLL
jgi:hypothetical protein